MAASFNMLRLRSPGATQADVQQLVVAMLVAVVGLVDSWAGTALPRRWLVACLAVASLLALALRYPVWSGPLPFPPLPFVCLSGLGAALCAVASCCHRGNL